MKLGHITDRHTVDIQIKIDGDTDIDSDRDNQTDRHKQTRIKGKIRRDKWTLTDRQTDSKTD